MMQVERKKYYSGCGCEAHPDFDFCVDCRIKELEAEIKRLEHLDRKWGEVYDKQTAAITELQARLDAVARLPEKWRKDRLSDTSQWDDGWSRSSHNCADELEQALEQKE